jgi:hypothetical protein
MRRRIHSIWMESMSITSMRPRGLGAIFMLSPEMHRMLRIPRRRAHESSLQAHARAVAGGDLHDRFGAAISTRHLRAGPGGMRGVAEGLSVKLIAATYGLMFDVICTSSSVDLHERAARLRLATTNSPALSLRSSSETGSV